MKVVDDFLYPDLYDKILDSLSDLDYKLIDDYDGSKKFEADLKTEVVEEVKACYQEKVRKPVGFFTASIVKCDPGYKYHIHYDHPDKLVSTVVYLHPDQGNGTFFVTKEEGLKAHFDEIIWYPNRLVSWINTGQRHMYRNTADDIRCTLNIYQKKIDIDFAVTPDD